MKEKRGFSVSGWIMLGVFLLLGFIVFSTLRGGDINAIESILVDAPFMFPIIFITLVFIVRGFYVIEPNDSRVLMFLGNYIGTDRTSGFRWTIPFFSKRRTSLRIQDYETEIIKVNDLNGNPIEVSAIVIWRVHDTYMANFDVEAYGQFITNQSVSALRGLAMKYPYQDFEGGAQSLITHTEEIADNLKVEIQERVDQAGIEIVESRINHLSYAKEIASAMLQRQQAKAIISAKTEIVEGAVGMVEQAIDQLESKNIVSYNQEDKAKLVSNLLVVLVSDQGTQPIIQTNG